MENFLAVEVGGAGMGLGGLGEVREDGGELGDFGGEVEV